MEARESQRDIMRLAALENLPQSESSSSVSSTQQTGNKAFLDLSIRNKIQDRSTVTSLESLASSIDITDGVGDKSLKRNRDLITAIEKESQVKEQLTSFKGLFTVGDHSKYPPKKSRADESDDQI